MSLMKRVLQVHGTKHRCIAKLLAFSSFPSIFFSGSSFPPPPLPFLVYPPPSHYHLTSTLQGFYLLTVTFTLALSLTFRETQQSQAHVAAKGLTCSPPLFLKSIFS